MDDAVSARTRARSRWARVAASSALPLALAALGYAAARLAGLELRIDWSLWHLLEREALAGEPWHALRLLHAQPPGLNALAAGVLALARATGAPPDAVAGALFAAVAAATAWLVHRLLLRIAGPRVAAAGTILLVASPGFWIFAFDFFYPLPLLTAAAALLLAALRYFESGRVGGLAAAAAAALALTWTSALYAPPVAVGFVALVALLGPAPRRRALRVLVPMAVLAALWPAKNALVFGRPVNSSWLGFNLSNMSGVRSAALWGYLERGDPGPAARRWWSEQAPRGAEADPLLVAPKKSGGGRNRNHYVFLYAGPGLERASRRWIAEHPDEWLLRALSNYARATRPVDVHPYRGAPLGPRGPRWRAWRAAYAPAFADLRPRLERRAPELEVHRLARDLGGEPIPYTLFGLLLLPALVAGACVRLAAWRERDARARVALLALAFAGWTIGAPCLTDGSESNRMRLSAAPALLALGAFLVAEPHGARRRTSV